MIILNNILKDFSKIASEIKTKNEKVNEKNFIARLTICYTENEKQTNINTYNEIINYLNEINKLNFDYKIRDNKYIYLLSKTEFNNENEFAELKKIFNNGIKTENDIAEYKILTINIKNFVKYKDFLNLVLQTLKDSKKSN